MLRDFLKRLLDYTNFTNELEDFDKIHESIERDVVFKGTNLWILVFAIVVASVGLNMNSTAVIIGAMLISPLMGPINGIGYSIATYNFPLLRKSFQNFGFAVLAGLLASTGYFLLSPVATAHSELLARTSPTIYDVLIALFGGFAGIVAISSRLKGNVIPGVAIATALMPPLCTAGYGLATGQLTFFFGAFYLFTINFVFIALASLLVSQILKFPITSLPDDGQRKKTNRYIWFVIVATVVPSIYFGYGLVQKEKFLENASKLARAVSFFEGNYLLKHEINSEQRQLTLVFGGSELTPDQKEFLIEKAAVFGLEQENISIKQGLSITAGLTAETEIEELRIQVDKLHIELEEKKKELGNLLANGHMGAAVLDEISGLFPGLKSCAIADGYILTGKSTEPELIKLVLLETSSEEFNAEDKSRIVSWLKKRLKTNQIRVYFL